MTAETTLCLAIDAGGTSTRALLIAADGDCVGYGRAGGGNPVSWGPEAAARSVTSAVAAALEHRRSGLVPSTSSTSSAASTASSPTGPTAPGSVRLLGPAVMAMAGSSAAPTAAGWTAVLAEVGVDASVVYESDLLATFCAGTPELHGYAVVAGTGSSAIRVVDGAVAGTADGLGWLLGDGGSGFWIGHRAVRAALAELDGRGPATALTGLLLDALGVSHHVVGRSPAADGATVGDAAAGGTVGGAAAGGTVGDAAAGGTVGGAAAGGRPEALRDAVDALYRMRPVELSRFAALALSAAASGDVVAVRILDEAERRLVDALSAVHLPGHPGPVVLGGGIARRLPSFPTVVADAVRSWVGVGTERRTCRPFAA